jgi:phage terminase large subunit-like protein
MNIYLLVDSASEKKKTSDYTAMEVVGLGTDNNYYTLDLLRDRLNLKERGDALFRLHRKWRPLNVGYEKYGTMADIEYMQERMEREGYRFHIQALGGQMPKPDRIRRLIPAHQEGRWYYPKTMFRRNYEGESLDLIHAYINDEYLPFPVAGHDDMLDVKSRIFEEELQACFPEYQDDDEEDYRPLTQGRNRITGY